MILILAGQSNMSGRGGVTKDCMIIDNDDCLPRKYAGEDERILCLNANDQLCVAKEPLHAGIDRRKAGVGIGVIFAKEVMEQSQEIKQIILVPCADGGTAIDQWMEGEQLFEAMITRTTAARKLCEDDEMAMLWYQGESDTLSLALAESYKDKFQAFVATARRRLGYDIAVFTVALNGGLEKMPYRDVVIKAQKEHQVQKCWCLCVNGEDDENGCNFAHMQADGLHLSIDGYVIVATELAKLFLSKMKQFL